MLVVHRSSDAATLAHGLAELLSTPPSDPFAPDIVAVPAKGVERWLAQRLSLVLGAVNGDGVCANVEFPKPARLLDEVIQSVTTDYALAVERWSPEQMVWPLLEVIDASVATEPWCQSLAQHLGTEAEGKGRRLAVASRLARLFDDYGQSRPEMLRSWATGADQNGDGSPLPDDLAWKAELWRRLRAHIGMPSPTEGLGDACAALVEDPSVSRAPQRLSVFGASRLSPARLQILTALATHRDVHLWLNHASPALWETVRSRPPARRRRDDVARRQLSNPLLSSLSRDILELQQLLAATAPDATDVLHTAPPTRDNLLGWLKRDLAADRLPDQPPLLAPDDRSVQVHSCHGRTRQVEVLREVIVGLLADDPTLEPRDVLVMCPDVETFAPIIAATFSLGSDSEAAHPAAKLRVRLADRALRQTNDLFSVLAQLLELGTARITSSQLLDLAGAPAVRQRFGFTDEEIERLRDWTAGAGVRWGLDADHRATWQLGRLAHGSWQAGLDRLLLGVAMEGDDRLFGEVVPLDDVDSADIDLAGRLAELVARLSAAQHVMSGMHTAVDWMSSLQAAVVGLAATSYDTAWQELQLRSELDDIAETSRDSDVRLGLSDIRALLNPTLAGRPTRASFRTGTLTVCTLVPMRSVPHRVVCLLGLDDGVFPRQSVVDGDDVLGRDPWIGERDPRSEDRQLLLDAICAAQDHLVVTYTGADERTGAAVPPAVPLGELLDALDRTASRPEGARVRDAITTKHPLQAFDPRNFEPGRLHAGRGFSFDPLAHAGAVAMTQPRTDPPPFLHEVLPQPPSDDVELDKLKGLLSHPARGFLRQRLDVALTRAEDEPSDALPIELDGLETWQVGDRLLRQRLSGLEPALCRTIELRRGALPPGPLGERALIAVGRSVEALLDASTTERAHDAETYDVDVSLSDGSRLTGTVRGVRGDVLLTLTYSTLDARRRLPAWIDLLALSVARPDRSWSALTVGRAGKRVKRSRLGPVSATDAMAGLEELVALYRLGLCAPLPLPIRTASEYAAARHAGEGRDEAGRRAEQKWLPRQLNNGQWMPGERDDAEHQLIYGAEASLSAVVGDHLDVLARQQWSRLLTAETEDLV